MTIKAKLRFWFLMLVGSILLMFATVIYWSSSTNRQLEFYRELEKEGVTKANLYFLNKVDPQTLQQIYKSNNKIINEVQIAIYDADFNLLYHDAQEIDTVKETSEMLTKIASKGVIHFNEHYGQVVGLKLTYNDSTYLLTATAYDQYGLVKLRNLLATLVVLSLISLVMIYIIGGFFADKILLPLVKINNQVKEITASSLNKRIESKVTQDELGDLVDNFNSMLDRLESSFESQKMFVSNISHELRTPLAAIIVEIDLALAKEQKVLDYQRTLINTKVDAQKIVRLSNSLLDFAKASYHPGEIVFKTQRIDEIILEACSKLQKSQPNAQLKLIIDDTLNDDKLLQIKANSYLLELSFLNLFENACNYSSIPYCNITLGYDNKGLFVEIKDKGIGIKEEEMEKVFEPFYRSQNVNNKPGSGIGLALTKKILDLHHARISLYSQQDIGSTFTIRFQKKTL